MARRRKFDPEEMDPEELEELEEEDSRGILRDGQSVRVPLYMRDGSINPSLTPTQRAKAQHDQQTADAQARKFGLQDALQLHRPGFRYNTDAAARTRIAQAYEAYDAADTNAWKATSTTDNVPNRRATADAKAQAYAEYDREMADAWRTRR